MRVVYCVYCNQDTVEGRGPMVLRATFDNEADAKKLANELEPYGFPNQFNNVEKFIVHQSYDEYSTSHVDNLRKQALKKLTPEECIALGIK